jgi:hypothetical protein
MVSGTVYETDAAGRRPLAGATVEFTDSATAWGLYGRLTTDAAGCYAAGPLQPRHISPVPPRPATLNRRWSISDTWNYQELSISN